MALGEKKTVGFSTAPQNSRKCKLNTYERNPDIQETSMKYPNGSYWKGQHKSLHKCLQHNYESTSVSSTLSTATTASHPVNPDSIRHKITDCAEGKLLWNWTREKLRMTLQLDHSTYRRTGRYAPPFTIGPNRGKWRRSGFWPSSSTTNFRHTGASPYRITWIFSNESDGKLLILRINVQTQAITWTYSRVTTNSENF